MNFLIQLSQRLPPRLVGYDDNWPSSPTPLKDASEGLKEMYRMSLVRGFMKKLTADDRDHVSWTGVCDVCTRYIPIYAFISSQITLYPI